ncbi:MAG TPA: hypothetical protein VGZ02_17940 [Candidatus Baltobacteraceae bacterium]|jgi:hypothetical protein|nr:hypothetical protein [Candidatus Baltobacteraceae bacterium]
MVGGPGHPYGIQVLTLGFAVAIPAILIVLIIGTAIYNMRRRHRRPPAH